jgi:hypothetical protein
MRKIYKTTLLLLDPTSEIQNYPDWLNIIALFNHMVIHSLFRLDQGLGLECRKK